ncbi:helix-turn-helix transcriptional regulator [Streptomyces sp. RKAG293]|uniref:helix-turn-helix domain-containing protein n=1 Tax=Streptomyces sp. RKAG293 TaxID=2893403 RepID=UPI00203431C3|nr:helix-turn-helix transcriptional regulator [Streptomyces sp. RKAG293]MCM2422181.1 helix-turn-helix transcriptional regulator [Streptomyces sp. RKAG293]
MGRPVKDIELDGSPIRLFAFWLRDLRGSADLTLEQLARRTGYGRTTVSDAMGGVTFPSRRVTLAVVEACAGDLTRWTVFWGQVRRALDRDPASGPADLTPPPWEQLRAPTAGESGPVCPPGCLRTDLHGYYTESVDTRLRLDTRAPEAVETRVVVSTCDRLARIPLAFSVPRHTDDVGTEHGLHVSVVRGGRLQSSEHPYESYFRQELALRDPVPVGARHIYVLRLRIPSAQPMAPHFVHIPLTRSERFRLHVRFDPARPPRTVWRLNGVPTAVIYQRLPGTSPLKVNPDATVAAGFTEMKVGYGYGLRWQDA